MPSKKKKYNARFPAGRIKKIMQTDEEVGKVAQAVPVIISRTLELFVESLLTKSMQITQARNAKTLTPSHMKQCILSESRFDFLKDLVKNIPDASVQEDNENNALFEENSEIPSKPEEQPTRARSSIKNSLVNETSAQLNEQSTSSSCSGTTRTPVIQYTPKIGNADTEITFSVNTLLKEDDEEEPKLHITIASEEVPKLVPSTRSSSNLSSRVHPSDNVPPLVPITRFSQNTTENNLYIDEDYDN